MTQVVQFGAAWRRSDEAAGMIRRVKRRPFWSANGDMLAVVDTGPLYAAVDADDQDHERCLRALEAPGLRLFIPAMVVAEVTYLVGSRLGPKVEAAFLASLAGLEVEAPAATDWPRIAELVGEYADFPLGGTDASVIALAERLGTDVIMTLDRRHFDAIRPALSRAWQLLPE